MNHVTFSAILLALAPSLGAGAPGPLRTDTLRTSAGDLGITPLGHGSLMFSFARKVILVDPYGAVIDAASLPKADLVLITHEHRDHLDPAALAAVSRPETVVVATRACAERLPGCRVMANGDTLTLLGVRIEAVPAYNLLHKRDNGQPFHPRGVGNGYILTFGDTRVYVAGDTENTPEMKALTHIECAFLPMNLPYTMTAEMVVDAIRAFRPRILYPYHCGAEDCARLAELLREDTTVEVRFRVPVPPGQGK